MAGAPFPIDPDDPLALARGQSVDGLLALLEQLDGAEEAAVVRSALAAGVPRERGTTRSKPAASARRLVAASTWE